MQEESSQAVSSPGDQKPKSRHRMLVVEDARCMRNIVVALLGKMSIDVETAENGQIACEMAMKSKDDGAPYDLILMDMQMPVMNGRDATRWLRQHDWKGPIIAATAYTTDEDHDRFLKAGCDDWVSKPLTDDTLQSVFSQYLELPNVK